MSVSYVVQEAWQRSTHQKAAVDALHACIKVCKMQTVPITKPRSIIVQLPPPGAITKTSLLYHVAFSMKTVHHYIPRLLDTILFASGESLTYSHGGRSKRKLKSSCVLMTKATAQTTSLLLP